MKNKNFLCNCKQIIPITTLSLIIFFISSIVSILLLFGVLHYEFNNLGRFFYLLFSLTPAYIFILTFYLYNSICQINKMEKIWYFLITIAFILFLMPAFLFEFRFYPKLMDLIQLYEKTIIWSFVLIPTSLISLVIFSKEALEKFLNTCIIKRGLLDFWKNECKIDACDAIDLIHEKYRVESYQNLENLKIFQNTLSCTRFEAKESATLISVDIDEIRILDIGGFDGTFMHNLIIYTSWTNKKIIIDVIEPLNTESAYKVNLSSLIDKNNITIEFYMFTYQEWYSNNECKYNLIIASHSLYAICDNYDLDGQTILKQLKALLLKDAEILIILSSKYSQAYTLKRELLNKLFKNPLKNDLTMLSFCNQNKLVFTQDLEGTFDIKSITVDSYIDLTDLLKNQTNLINWLSYFIRVNYINKDMYTSLLQDIVNHYILRGNELPECLSKYFWETSTAVYGNNSLLLHKTEIMHFKYKTTQ